MDTVVGGRGRAQLDLDPVVNSFTQDSVHFRPTRPGAVSASVTITSNDPAYGPGEGPSMVLLGRGVAPYVPGSSFDFGDLRDSTTSAPHRFEVLLKPSMLPG